MLTFSLSWRRDASPRKFLNISSQGNSSKTNTVELSTVNIRDIRSTSNWLNLTQILKWLSSINRSVVSGHSLVTWPTVKHFVFQRRGWLRSSISHQQLSTNIWSQTNLTKYWNCMELIPRGMIWASKENRTSLDIWDHVVSSIMSNSSKMKERTLASYFINSDNFVWGFLNQTLWQKSMV
jgi:hypothetical protein